LELEWKREFESIGAHGVRAALIARRWNPDKRSAAREWLERNDAIAWQATRPAGEGRGETTMDVFRRYKWAYAAIGGAFGLLALSQMLKLW
jgi:hypothetical protein